ncbi:NAD(P)-dependent oxidoreductase [Marinibaculum pumilum]|uniref:dihydrouracil dehydrogenase (NAD(+)) n=1 Tax=Marinibaculum pumilum TaxID=1766165 RepID=A0ABV7KZT4_9PROT
MAQSASESGNPFVDGAEGGGPDIAAHRLPADAYAANFADVKPVLNRREALVEASRCHFCYDAPCVTACPTGIDIPRFIRGIATDNVRGAAMTILEANIMGAACARVCPTEVLCEEVCVREKQEGKPVRIGALQRYATDDLLARGEQPFTRAPSSGRKVAVVGAGPAGLACAHALARQGHDVTVFEAREKAGGLNEYGIAAYKMPGGIAQAEVDFILGVGGIELRCGQALGRDISLAALRKDFDAVFLGTGQAGVNALRLEGEDMPGVLDAVDYIAELRQAPDLSALAVGRRVVVIGGGNTAVDIAVQCRRLGAEEVTMLYRRGPAQMSATWKEREFAQVNGVKIRFFAAPVRLLAEGGRLAGVECAVTELGADGSLEQTARRFTVEADMLFKAIGQSFVADPVTDGAAEALEIAGGRIAVNDARRTTLPDVWAGGDCIAGEDLTVAAVEDGKVAAASIHAALTAG